MVWLVASFLVTARADVAPCGCGGHPHPAPEDGPSEHTGSTGTTGDTAAASFQRATAGASAALSAGVLVVGLRRRRPRGR